MLVDNFMFVLKNNHTILKLRIFITIFLIVTFQNPSLHSKDPINKSIGSCTKFIGDWQCGEKQVVEKIREVDEINYTVKFDFSRTGFVINSKPNSEPIPFLCMNGKLKVDINSNFVREVVQSLSNNVERKNFISNPGTYQFDKNDRITYQTYDIIDKKNISTKCIKLNLE